VGDRPGASTGVDPLPEMNPKIAARIVNGEALILTPHDSVLHTLNPVATRIWELMRVSDSVQAVVAAICEEFDVAKETAEADLHELLADLRERKILN
jgi:hypothetical protein